MNVLCRHCFRLFPYERIGVLCGSPVCGSVLNTEGRRGPRFMLAAKEKGLWLQRGRCLELDAPCPYCSRRGRLTPACPHCRRPLDPEVGQVEDRMIAVLGAREAGKSHFLATLFHQLLEVEVGNEIWKVTLGSEERRTAERELLRPLFRELRELPATAPGPGTELRLVLTHQRDGRRVLLVFRDLAGEVMMRRDLLAQADFLRYAQGVVLLADPLAFEPPPRGRHRDWHHGEPECTAILESYRAVLESTPRLQGDEILPLTPERKFLAVAVTKADLVLHRDHPFWSPTNGHGHLDRGFWRARCRDSAEAESWLRQRLDDPRAFAAAVEAFADAAYFFISSFGYLHKPHTRSLRKPPVPLRVHEPLFALLDRFEDEEAPGARPLSRPAARPHRSTRRAVADDDVL